MPPPSAAPALTATYRLQLRAGLTLDRVREEWLDPLAELGISHLYLSPVFEAAEGSTHGYDIVDPNRVDDAIGGDDAFVALCEAAHHRGLGVVIDLVPNHMATDHHRNTAWWDLLANGPASTQAGMFDLDWDAPERRLRGKLLLPILPDHYGRELERRAFRLEIVGNQVRMSHPSAPTPIETGSLAPVIAAAAAALADDGLDDKLAELATDMAALPPWPLPHIPDELERRRSDEPVLRARLATALEDPAIRAAIQAKLDDLTNDIEALDQLIDAQPYRLARWQTSLEDLGYRRFFDINTLIGVRVDRKSVFDETHRSVASWVADGLVDGLRIDHVDGLRNPSGYLEWLATIAPDSWVLVEKILEGDEELPPWPISGTTGYEVGEMIGRLDLDDGGRPNLERLARRLTGVSTDVPQTIRAAKEEVLDEPLSADLNRLTELLLRVCEQRRRFRDVTRRELHQVLRAVLVRLPYYRTYVRPSEPGSPQDHATIHNVLADVAEELPDLDREVLELLELLLPGDGADTEQEWDFVLRFQQLSGPTMAKGAEDTAWFRLPALISRSEVGADPEVWEIGLEEFHDAMVARQRDWPLAMTATSTHDTKRSEDVRARLALLSQRSDSWTELAEEWMEQVAPTSPDPASSFLMLQTMIGAWPLDADRLVDFSLKAAREAKVRTSWLHQDEGFENDLVAHARAVMDDEVATAMVEQWVATTDLAWRTTALSQKLLALTLPGVPDLYQGSEHWFLRLTDPDNRAAPDPGELRGRLQELRSVDHVLPDHEFAKIAVTRAALDTRARLADSFGPTGGYQPLWASGPRSDHAVAFQRGTDAIVVTPRKVTAILDGWRDTCLELPDGSWRNVLDGSLHHGNVDLGHLLAVWPLALLVRDGEAETG